MPGNSVSMAMWGYLGINSLIVAISVSRSSAQTFLIIGFPPAIRSVGSPGWGPFLTIVMDGETTVPPASDLDRNNLRVGHLMQLRAMYELTTGITSKCFETCIGRLNPRLEESDKNCLSNCAANFLHMKLLFAQRLIEAAKTTQLEQ